MTLTQSSAFCSARLLWRQSTMQCSPIWIQRFPIPVHDSLFSQQWQHSPRTCAWGWGCRGTLDCLRHRFSITLCGYWRKEPASSVIRWVVCFELMKEKYEFFLYIERLRMAAVTVCAHLVGSKKSYSETNSINLWILSCHSRVLIGRLCFSGR